MTNRHFYKHRETGIVAAMNDSFAAVFGDRLTRVEAPSNDVKADTSTTSTETAAPAEAQAPVAAEAPAAVAEPAAANPDNVTTDSAKESA